MPWQHTPTQISLECPPPPGSKVHQTNLPAISKPSLSQSADGDINAKLRTGQEKQKSQYDKMFKQLSVIHPDDPVHILKPHSYKWEPSIVK